MRNGRIDRCCWGCAAPNTYSIDQPPPYPLAPGSLPRPGGPAEQDAPLHAVHAPDADLEAPDLAGQAVGEIGSQGEEPGALVPALGVVAIDAGAGSYAGAAGTAPPVPIVHIGKITTYGPTTAGAAHYLVGFSTLPFPTDACIYIYMYAYI